MTRETLAIKRMKKKFDTWEEAMSLREIKVLRKLNHPNVVKLKEVIRERSDLFLVFEFVNGTVLDLIKENHSRNRSIREETIKTIIRQCLVGIDYCHG